MELMINIQLSEKCSLGIDDSTVEQRAARSYTQSFSCSSSPHRWRARAAPSCLGITEPHTCWGQEELSPPSLEGSDRALCAKRTLTVKIKRKAQVLPNMEQQDKKVDNEDGDAVRIVGLLKSCAENKDLHLGTQLHAEIVAKQLLDTHNFVGSTLVHMYVKCNALEKAQDVFNKLRIRDTVSWTALMGGYAQHGHGEETLKCFEQMLHEGVAPDMFTFSCLLKACCAMGAAQKGGEIHSRIVKDCFLERNLVLANVMIDMYAKCGVVERAQAIFDELPVKDAVSWTTLIAGYTESDREHQAFMLFEKMRKGGFSPSIATFLSILKGCGSMGAADKGQEIHSQIVKEGLYDASTMVTNALVAMYGKVGLLVDAKLMCERLPARDIITWNTLIGGYTHQGYGEEALDIFDRMQHEGFSPNAITFTSTLKACGMVGAANKGNELFKQIVKQHLLEKNVVVANAVIDMFCKCGLVRRAQEVFDKLRVRDVVSWNALIVGYSQQGYEEKAMACFERMQSEGFAPDAITFASILKASGTTGAAVKGQEIHAMVVGDGLLDKTMDVNTALVYMYAKNGMLIEAQEVFDNSHVHDVILWNVLLAGYSQFGQDEVVFCLLGKLEEEGTKPDSATFTSVLNTCSHRGLLDKGQSYFVKLSKGYGLTPTLEHLTCMIDLFCRAGHLVVAVTIIETMSFSADSTLWLTVLSACQRWGKMTFGMWAFEQAAEAEGKIDTVYA
ncbi:hypothetical protein GOP47_0015085 [Adiantum capillus-veneris]|uniref:Pentatricopeptide repeat-containing protein n=1 Tax=Adiantum capillus-veneris TaxID=13818 RepID=A0A9D4UN81_ADICA|nr:hypothetical protein GOP47_0015085 [Adiantum capillus-veneris]